MLYERTALSRKPEKLIAQELQTLHSRGEVTPAMVLKDPYKVLKIPFESHVSVY